MIRAVDLPQVRADLIDHYRKPEVIDWWAATEWPPASTRYDGDEAIMVCDPSGDERRTAEIIRLEQADLYFVTGSMTSLAVAAAASLPEFRVKEFDIPSRHGFIIFQEPIAVDRNFSGEDVHISGASWSVLANPILGLSLWISFYVDNSLLWDGLLEQGTVNADEARRQKAGQPRYVCTVHAEWSFGAGGIKGDGEGESILNLWGRTLVSTWLLMQQPLADVSETQLQRPFRRRLERAGHKARPVRVIELRRSHCGGGGESGREYHHKWIVRGHWRQQWYPARQVHRPVWIAPHIKGPEDAPLLGGDKVHLWKR